jgi:hypothetical protein
MKNWIMACINAGGGGGGGGEKGGRGGEEEKEKRGVTGRRRGRSSDLVCGYWHWRFTEQRLKRVKPDEC